jgi:hypothetical protein
MNEFFTRTHEFFRIDLTNKETVWGSEEADMCRHYLGDNPLLEPLQNRTWFTAPDGLYIRRDCLKNELATWFALKNKNEYE